MPALEDHYKAMLENLLESEIVPHLPSLIRPPQGIDEERKKNLSRAFSAFALQKLLGISALDAAQSVVDDFDDYGIDSIFYYAGNETLYVVQAKFKANLSVNQDDANAFCRGIRKLLAEDFDAFNQNFQSRILEIQDAIENCRQIQIVIAHIGVDISHQATTAINELIAESEERLAPVFKIYDAECIIRDLQNLQAYANVQTDLRLHKCIQIDEPRLTYYGLVAIKELVAIHIDQGQALYAKNIRTFLGQSKEVNASIQRTLAERPQEFFFLNNGVTALCETIDLKGAGKSRKLEVTGLSVINGAQTIASSAQFAVANPEIDISSAKVSFTLIQIEPGDDFGKVVTQSRNHQNPVSLADFAALDDEQERLRRDIAHLGIQYVYKAEVPDSFVDPNSIRFAEAAGALAMMQNDPRYVVWLKREPQRLLDAETDQYKALFNSSLTAFQLINAVRFFRYIQARLLEEIRDASVKEKLIYKHGNYAIGWVLTKRVKDEINSHVLLDDAKIRTSLSAPFDELRSIFWDKTNAEFWDETDPDPERLKKGPLAFFKNQADVNSLLETVLINYFGLGSDTSIAHRRSRMIVGQAYPEALFQYLIAKAPQISNLT